MHLPTATAVSATFFSGATMSNQLGTNENQSTKKPMSRAGAESGTRRQSEGPNCRSLLTSLTPRNAPLPSYRPYAEKPALSEPPYEPYKGM